MRAEDFLDSTPQAGGISAEDFLGPAKQDNPFVRGLTQANSARKTFGALATGDYGQAAKLAAEREAYQRANPGSPEGNELMAAWEKGDGIIGGVKGVAGEMAKDWRDAPTGIAALQATGKNLSAMGGGIVEQVPNMIMPMAGMLAGGAAGSLAGPVGTVAGAFTGAATGNAAAESSEQVDRAIRGAGINPQDTGAVRSFLEKDAGGILGKSAIKGGIIGAVDTATMGVGSKVLNAPVRAAADRAIASLGIDAADKAAVSAAKNEIGKRIMADSAYQASQKGGQALARNAGVAALEPAGEFAGEYLGQGAATGDWDTKGAMLEALSSLGQSGITYAGQKIYQYATSPARGAKAQESTQAEQQVSQGEQQPITGLLSAPRRGINDYTQESTSEFQQQRQSEIDAADKNAADLYAMRDAFEASRQNVVLTTDPVPLQKRIDTMLGLDTTRMDKKGRAQYEKDLAGAFNEPVGITHDANQREVSFTMGEYLDAQVAANDAVRARENFAAQSGNRSSVNRLAQLAEEEAVQNIGIVQDLTRSAAQGGALSRAALTGIQTGATQMPVHPERAAIQQQMLADEAAQAELAPIELFMRGRNERQLQNLSAPGHSQATRQAATAEIERRMTDPVQNIATNPVTNVQAGAEQRRRSELAANANDRMATVQKSKGHIGFIAATENSPVVQEIISRDDGKIGVADVGKAIDSASGNRFSRSLQKDTPGNRARIIQELGVQVAPAVQSDPQFDVSKRTDAQLAYLASNGRPGWKEAAAAELQRRGKVSPVSPVSPGVQAAPVTAIAPDRAANISRLQKQLKDSTPMSRRESNVIGKLISAVTDDASKSIEAGSPPAYSADNGTFIVIHPSAQQDGMIQVTRYAENGVFGDSQYNNVEDAIRDNGVWMKRRMTEAEATDALGTSAKAEAEYEKRKSAEATKAANREKTAEPQKTDSALQNRDRGRAASVNQMQSIARNPDYMRLGPSRTPDSGAPMVFAVGNDLSGIPAENFGASDVAVMADGQRVPFRYAVIDASRVQPSNFADGMANPAFASNERGTIKALNNGRTAGIRAAHSAGNVDAYVGEMIEDGAHGVSSEAIRNTPNPMLVRVYAEDANTDNMAAKSQGQGLGMSASERAAQDAEVMTGDVLDKFAPLDIAAAGNRDFVRAFVGKLPENELADMMDATGNLSQDGRRRIEAALLTAAYGKSDLVQELFESTDTDIKAIGNALKVVSGQWATMRQAAKDGVIDPAVDMTGNLMEAVNIIRRSRAEGSSVAELAGQGDLMGGNYLNELSELFLRIFYRGAMYDRARGGEKVITGLQDVVTSAMNTKADAGLFGDSFKPTPKQIVQSARNKIDEKDQPASQSALFGANGQATAAGQGNRGEGAAQPGEVGQRSVSTGSGEGVGEQARQVAKETSGKAAQKFSPVSREFEYRGVTWRITVHESQWQDGAISWTGEKNVRGVWEKVPGDDIPEVVAKKASDFYQNVRDAQDGKSAGQLFGADEFAPAANGESPVAQSAQDNKPAAVDAENQQKTNTSQERVTNSEKNEHVEFARRGDYWIYSGDRAKEIAKVLGLTVTQRNGIPEVAIVEHAREMASNNLDRVGIDVRFAAVDAKKEQKSGPYTLAEHKDLIERLNDGKLGIEEFKAAFARLRASKDALTAEFQKMTKPQIMEAARLASHWKNDAKDRLVRVAVDNLPDDFDLRETRSYVMGQRDSTLMKAVDETTQETLDAYSARRKAAIAERNAYVQKKMAGAKDPKAIEDFDNSLRLKKAEGMTFAEARMSLTPEQRAEYDRLKGIKSRDERKSRADQQKAEVRVAAQTTDGQVVETKHTRTGEPLFVVKAAERVEREIYNQWNATAKRLGGHYSSFRGNGAVPGFQFKTRENADAFLAFIGGNAAAAKEVVQDRRDSFADDKSQSAVERLNEMADRLDEKANESLGRERKANTERRARFAASAESAANAEKALAMTMRRIADAISNGTAQFLDRVRQKAQVEYLSSVLRSAHDKMLRERYPSYGDYVKHKDGPPTSESADYAEFPQYAMMRSDLASLARQIIMLPGMKALGQRVLKLADDTSDAYNKFAKDNLPEVSRFGRADGSGFATFSTMKDAERSIEASNLQAVAVPLQIKRGEYRIVLSPSEAMKRGIWQGDDRKIFIGPDDGAEIVEKLGKLNRKAGKRGDMPQAPWQFENAYNDRKRLAGMGIEQPWEFRAMLREFSGLKEAPKELDKIKQMEREMIGRRNDGLDFFPTSAGVVEQMLSAAEIQEGMAVLEPSAGMGHIADAIREAGVEPDVVELSNDRKELLEAKGFNVVGRDFMEAEGQYDRIIMNPPFSNRRDAEHVQHAYTLLRPGGRLVAIMGEGVFFGQDKKAQQFRDWLEDVGGTSEKLDEGTFMDPSLPVNTATNARMVVINKPKTDNGVALYSKSGNATQTIAISRQQAESRIKSILGDKLGKVLIDSGIVSFTNNGDEYEGATYKDGSIVLNLDALNDGNFAGVFAHEGFHSAIRDLVGEQTYAQLMKRLDNMRALGNGGQWFKDAVAAVPADTKAEHVTEEIAAYAVKGYVNGAKQPNVITRWVESLLSALRTAIIRRLPFGKLKSWAINNLQPQDLANLAIAGLKAKAKEVAKKIVDLSSTNPDIRYSRAKIIGDSGRQYDQTQRQFFKNVGRDIDKKNLVERTTEYLKNDFWKKMAVGIVDQFRGLRDLGDNGQAYMLARLSKGTAGAFDALLHHGKLSIRDGVYDADTSGGFIERLGVPLHGELDDFLWYVAANRAERLSKVDREHLFTPADIAAGKSLANGTTDFDYTIQTGPAKGKTTRVRAVIYGDALRVFNEFQRNALDMAEQSGLIDGASRKLWESEFYVPFYRVSEEDGEFIGSKIGNALVRQQAFKKLKGGTDKLNSDLLSNTLLNFSHLIEASAKNRAAKAALVAAEKVGAAQRVAGTMAEYAASDGKLLPPGTKKTVWYMGEVTRKIPKGQTYIEGGVEKVSDGTGEVAYTGKIEYAVSDPFVMTAITSLEYAGMRNGVMDVMTKFKHWLTIGVTASPAFKVRNLIRDSIQSIGASELGYNPIKNITEGYKQTRRDSQEYVSALASGALIRFGTMLEGSESARVRQLVKSGVKDSTILNSENKWRAFYDQYLEPAVSAYNELGNRSEEINRAALYNQLVKQGKSHAEAALLARDLMDFSMQGSFNTIRFLTQVVPFMNARLQGMYKLGRAAKDNPRKLAVVTGAVAMASIALMLAYGDDDDWKRREDWDRDNFWWFKLGGIEFRIPKPFEIGAIATLAERGLELMIDDEMTGERFRRVVNSLAMNNLSMNPIPQAFKPILDLYANKDSFTGRPIESMGMERLDPTERFNSNTTMVARGLSSASLGALSPVQFDHLTRSYFGWLGSFVIGGADMAMRAMSDEPTKPALDYFRFGTQGILKEAGTGGSRYVTQVYEQAKELEQAHATWRQMLKDGRIEEAKDYAADNRDKLIRYRQVEAVKRTESNLNERIRRIERSDMDSSEKKNAIALVNKQKEAVAMRIAPGIQYGP